MYVYVGTPRTFEKIQTQSSSKHETITPTGNGHHFRHVPLKFTRLAELKNSRSMDSALILGEAASVVNM